VGSVAHEPGHDGPELAGRGPEFVDADDAPLVLEHPFALGAPLPDMAGLPELAAAHRGWVDLEHALSSRARPVGVRATAARIALGLLRRHPEYRHQRELLAQLTRVADALAKRCDELDRRLRLMHDQMGEVAAVLSEDLTRLNSAVVTHRENDGAGEG
jgi:hypothetical protein